MDKELAQILLSCALWNSQLSEKRVLSECDNSSVVLAINKQSSKQPLAMHMLHFFVAYFDIDIKCRHIAVVINCSANYLSRNNLHSFFIPNPQVAPIPTPISMPVWRLLVLDSPDWTSPVFRQLFTIISQKV